MSSILRTLSLLFLFPSLVVLSGVRAGADDLPDDIQDVVRERYGLADKNSKPEVILVADRVPSCLDEFPKVKHTVGIGSKRPSAKREPRTKPAELEIRGAEAEITETCPYATLLSAGSPMRLEKWKIDDDRIEFELRKLYPVQGGPEEVDLYARVRLRFRFQNPAGVDAGSVLALLEQWVLPRPDEKR